VAVGGFDATPFGITPAPQRPTSGQAWHQAFVSPMLPPRRYRRGPLRAIAAECVSWLLRLGPPTISVRETARNPAMPHAAPTATKPRGSPNRAVAAGLRAPAARPSQSAPTPGTTVPFKRSRIDPLNREPTAEIGTTTPFKPFRTDPLNREPGVFPDLDLRPPTSTSHP
jgi:hypothetical protein